MLCYAKPSDWITLIKANIKVDTNTMRNKLFQVAGGLGVINNTLLRRLTELGLILGEMLII